MKYSKKLPKQKQGKNEPEVIFVLRVLITEMPFALIRFFQALVKVTLVSDSDKWIFFASSGCLVGVISLSSLLLKKSYYTQFTIFTCISSMLILAFLSVKSRLDFIRNRPSEDKEKVLDEDEEDQYERYEEDPEPEQVEVKRKQSSLDDSLSAVEEIEEIVKEANKEVDVEKEPIPVHEDDEINKLLGIPSRSPEKTFKETVKGDMDTLNLDEILETDWMKKFNQLQAEMNYED